MPVETVETSGSTTTVERHGLGARGVDLIERGTQTRYPLYDAHGNSVATMGRSGSSWSLGDQRAYDAWGRIRTGLGTGAPSARFCANLGHVQDDESGLIYMRARYYEAGTGRFVSQDPAMDGQNWFGYCSNNPVTRVDIDGRDDEEYMELGLKLFTVGRSMMTFGVGQLASGASNMMRGLAVGSTGVWPIKPITLMIGMILQVWGGMNAIQGTARVTTGLYVSKAGQYLMALGEDGLEYATAYLQAAKGESSSAGNTWLDEQAFGF